MSIEFLSPAGLHQNPAFSQAVAVSGAVRTVYVGGQNAVDKDGQVVGKGNLAAQTERALKNLKSALEAGGATTEQVVKMTIYVVHGQSLADGYAAFQKVWGTPPKPPVVSSFFVAELAVPQFLVEIEAIAVVPE
jgi:enamine deaminase RidA (YjgF/YER057c/UK114 family)